MQLGLVSIDSWLCGLIIINFISEKSLLLVIFKLLCQTISNILRLFMPSNNIQKVIQFKNMKISFGANSAFAASV